HTLTASSFFFFCSSVAHLDLPSFPTRRSSDLSASCGRIAHRSRGCRGRGHHATHRRVTPPRRRARRTSKPNRGVDVRRALRRGRSEEHTSELQSRSDLVCRLLLEKKKKKNINN